MINKYMIAMVIAFLVVMTAAGANSVANVGVGECCGDTVLPITVTIADNVGSCDVTLEYDPEIVSVVGIRDGDMDITTSDTTRRHEGTISVAAQQNADSEGMYGTFVIANIVFECNTKIYDKCPLEIRVTEFREHTSAARSMVYSTSDGMYDSECLMRVPGFLGVLAIAVILAAAYLIERRRRNK